MLFGICLTVTLGCCTRGNFRCPNTLFVCPKRQFGRKKFSLPLCRPATHLHCGMFLASSRFLEGIIAGDVEVSDKG